MALILQEPPLTVQLAPNMVDDELEPYTPNQQLQATQLTLPTQPTRIVAFGGGWDSLALTRLLSEMDDNVAKDRRIVLVHQLEEKVTSQIPELAEWLVGQGLADTSHIVRSNSRAISQPPGYATWPAVLTAALFVANHYQTECIFLGGNLGSTFLNSGRGYHPTHLRPSQWYRLFQTAGLPLVMPLGGVSDLGVYRIMRPLADHAIYCQRNGGTNCHRCWKCFRRHAIQSAVEDNDDLDSFKSYQLKTFFELWRMHFKLPSSGAASKLSSQLSQVPVIGKLLPKSPTGDFGPSLLWALARLPELQQEWSGPRRQLPWPHLGKYQQECLNTWLPKYYPPSLQLIQSRNLRNLVQTALQKYLEPMTPEQQEMLHKY